MLGWLPAKELVAGSDENEDSPSTQRDPAAWNVAMEWCPRVLGWLLAEELAAGNDEDVPAAQREPAARIVAMERCFARMDVEVTSAGERTSCWAQRAEQIEAALPVSRSSAVGCGKTGAGSGLPAARTSRSGRRRRSGSPSPCSDSPLLGLLGGSSMWPGCGGWFYWAPGSPPPGQARGVAVVFPWVWSDKACSGCSATPHRGRQLG